jgi:membrane-bound serine protease (ClpP class)
MPRLARTIAGLPALLGLVGLLLAGCAAPAEERAGAIVVLPTTGVVDNVMAGYIDGGVERAAEDGAVAVIVELDTPGGSLDATQDIVSALLDPPLAVIVWVGPAGAKAASAGTFITLSANLAYMAPGTTSGLRRRCRGVARTSPATWARR